MTFEEACNWLTEIIVGKPKRARTKTGRYQKDNPKTKNVNEAYVRGKSPFKKKRKYTRKKK